jgi:hypothetical protein
MFVECCVILLGILIVYYIYKSTEVKYIKSDIDSKRYVVLNKYDSKNAADMLATISKNLTTIKDYLAKHHGDTIVSQNIQKRFDTSNISEGSPDSQYTSYTINKGDKMVFCLRDKETKRLHDLNLLMYVSLHELAHVGCVSIGHNGEFHKHFNFLLEIAEKIGIYTKISFGDKNVEYCGLTL